MSHIYSPHLHLAKMLWTSHLKKGFSVLDATCGNGHDTLFLAQSVLTPLEGYVLSLDIQQSALQNTKKRLQDNLESNLLKRVELQNSCHANFQTDRQFHLIVYNLGYLPGGNKEYTTMCSTTLASLKHAQQHLTPDGAISIVCYPGHSEGRVEERDLLEFTSLLDPKIWSVCHHKWVNRSQAPSLIWMALKPQSKT